MEAPPIDVYAAVKDKRLVSEKYFHDHVQWSTQFQKVTSQQPVNRSSIAQLRIIVIYQTMKACRDGAYVVYHNDGSSGGATCTSVAIDERITRHSSEASELIDATVDELAINEALRNSIAKYSTTDVRVLIGDCLEAGLLLKQKYGPDYPVAVLNMANQKTPGGGYLAGSGAQEENLHRRTNLFQCLHDPDKIAKNRTWSYPLQDFSGVFTPNAVVLRSSEATGYEFLADYQTMNFITVAAYLKPKTYCDGNGVLRFTDEMAEKTEKKIRLILNMALLKGMKAVVLSAFGCGAYSNPPREIARLFHKVLPDYEGAFEHVHFAIFNDHNANKKHNPDGNIAPFEEYFGPGSVIHFPVS